MINKNEREIIDTLDKIISTPLPAGGGTQSASIRGVASYAREMRQLVPLAVHLIAVMRQGEAYDGERAFLLRQADELMQRFHDEREKS